MFLLCSNQTCVALFWNVTFTNKFETIFEQYFLKFHINGQKRLFKCSVFPSLLIPVFHTVKDSVKTSWGRTFETKTWYYKFSWKLKFKIHNNSFFSNLYRAFIIYHWRSKSCSLFEDSTSPIITHTMIHVKGTLEQKVSDT